MDIGRLGPQVRTFGARPAVTQAEVVGARPQEAEVIGRMIDGRCSVAERARLEESLGVFGVDALRLVEGNGTRIRLVDRDDFAAVVDQVSRQYGLDPGPALPAGLYANKTLYLRRDDLAKLPRDLTAKVHRHEFGHALMSALGGAIATRQKALHARVEAGVERPVTSYAATDFREYFSESVAAWVTPPREFSGRLAELMQPLRSRVYGVVSRHRDELRAANPSAAVEMDWLFSEHIPQRAAPG